MCRLKTKIEAAEEGETDVRREECSDTEKEQGSNDTKKNPTELFVLLG